MASGSLVTENDDQILIRGNSRVRVLVLNRPKKYNVLTYSMLLQLINGFKNFEEEAAARLVIVKANGKAFCAGGDATAYYDHAMQGRWDFATRIYRTQLTLDYLVATCSKPRVFLLDGFVMGGGAGLSMNGTFKIVTENSIFAMPEAALGLFPDVGASYFLSRLPGFLGEYLGLTGARLDGAEMLSCGLATHFVPAKNLPLLEKSLCEMDSFDPTAIEETIAEYVQPASVKRESAVRRLGIINKCFSQRSVEEILSCLEEEVLVREEKWITDAVKSIKMASPISLKLFLVSIRTGRQEGIEQCLMREYKMASHVLKRTISDDFFEGVRAKLLDKDNKPKWEPPRLEMVGNEMVERYLSEVPKDGGWEDLHLPIKISLLKNLHGPKL